jgi:hypothetical protein
VTIQDNHDRKLAKEEKNRLDALLSAARGFHYSAFVISGISLALSSLDQAVEFKLPIGDIVVPRVQTAVGTYIAVVTLTMASQRLLFTAIPWLRLDGRRPAFAWIALPPKGKPGWAAMFWLLIPVIICSIATALTLKRDDITGFGLCFAGVFAHLLPHTVSNYLYLISTRQDHRGGPSTLSIWLLYWYRLLRGIVLILFLFIPMLAVVPQWRNCVYILASPVICAIIVLIVIRLLGSLPVSYRFIDRLGPRWGFPRESKHYK